MLILWILCGPTEPEVIAIGIGEFPQGACRGNLRQLPSSHNRPLAPTRGRRNDATAKAEQITAAQPINHRWMMV